MANLSLGVLHGKHAQDRYREDTKENGRRGNDETESETLKKQLLGQNIVYTIVSEQNGD